MNTFFSSSKFIVIALIIFCSSINYAQDFVYTPSESTVPVFTYYETKEKLKEAFNKATWISYDHIFDNEQNVYKGKENNIYDLKFYKSKFVFYSSVKSVKEVRSFVFSELNELKLYKLEEYDDIYKYGLLLNRISFYWHKKDLNIAKQFLNSLYSLKNKKYISVSINDEISRFEPIAEQYRNSNTKTELSESARKLIIQAISLTKENNTTEAINLYKQAIELDQSVPESHFNLALLYGTAEDYDNAIIEMKKYLLLVPNAKDMRAAKDKIYEWEAYNL